MTWDTAGALLALGATYILGYYSGKAVTLSKVGLTSQMRCLDRDVAVNDAADEEELPYRPAAEPYRFTYDTALRDLKPAVPPTAQVAREPEPPPATTTLSDRLAKGPW